MQMSYLCLKLQLFIKIPTIEFYLNRKKETTYYLN